MLGATLLEVPCRNLRQVVRLKALLSSSPHQECRDEKCIELHNPWQRAEALSCTGAVRCDLCGFPSANRPAMLAHQRLHVGRLPLSCVFCPRVFTQKPHLRDHVRTHTGERPFVCPVCCAGFAQKSVLTRHSRTTHKS
ncbi:uncharacterized protein LOC144112578 [Amblyomma americanum]